MNQELQNERALEVSATPSPMEVQLDSDKAMARIGSIANVIDKCVKVSVRRTNPDDWVKMGKSYYLQATGAQKIRPIWGIYYRDRKVFREDFAEGGYAYIVQGTVGSKVLDSLYGEITIEVEGGRNANDPFFTKGDRTPDPVDIRKAAVSNWEARAITALLGLKNMLISVSGPEPISSPLGSRLMLTSTLPGVLVSTLKSCPVPGRPVPDR